MNEEKNNIQAPNFEGEKMKMPENSSLPTFETESKQSVVNAPLLFVLTILLIAILGGMYYWFSKLNMEAQMMPQQVERPTAEENNEPESTTAEAQADAMQVTSTSDEITAIEADIEATNLDTLDADLNAIDAEIDAALTQ